MDSAIRGCHVPPDGCVGSDSRGLSLEEGKIMIRDFAFLLPALLLSTSAAAALLPGFNASPHFGEQVKSELTDTGVRIITTAAGEVYADRPTTVIFYATPNGNTAEQTLGCKLEAGMDWHFDIQHIAAQTRVLRKADPTHNYVLVCMQPQIKSWPTWRGNHTDSSAIIRGLIESAMKGLPGTEISAVITGHSGGGSMITGFIEAFDAIPAWVARIAYLDANYSYSDDAHHGDKLLAWLKANPASRLFVLAYDDRNITLDGKPVVSATGGTYRATHRMLDRFAQEITVDQSKLGDFDRFDALSGRIVAFIHTNPANKILHTALIGEMNGYLEAVTIGTLYESKWGSFGGPRAYTECIQPADSHPLLLAPRPKDAEGGAAVMARVSQLTTTEREVILRAEVENGNIPDFLRAFVTVRAEGTDSDGKQHTVLYQVMPDYLAVGSDADFVRVPLTPMTAQPIADRLSCFLPTRKVVNDIYSQAAVKLEPKPLTENREASATFVLHNSIIETQRAGKTLGLLVGGIKKDVVISNLLAQSANRVAIYGWHKLDGQPIQPLTTVHVNWYVDYSHGIRLVRREITLDGVTRDAYDILKDPKLAFLLSDEGPMTVVSY